MAPPTNYHAHARTQNNTAVNPPAHARRRLISVEIRKSVRKSLEKSRNQEIREDIRRKSGYRGKSGVRHKKSRKSCTIR